MINDHHFPFALNLFGKYVETVSFDTIASFSDLLDGFLQIRFSWSTLWGHLSTSFNLRQIETNLGAVFLHVTPLEESSGDLKQSFSSSLRHLTLPHFSDAVIVVRHRFCE